MGHSEDVSARQRWMGLLARAEETLFNNLWNQIDINPSFVIIRPSQQGLVMVRGRAGGSGDPFNVGEMTVTRCSIRLENGLVGHGYVAGRKNKYAEKAAIVDALMQDENYQQLLEQKLISHLEQAEIIKRDQDSKKASATKVDFFTLVRGED